MKGTNTAELIKERSRQLFFAYGLKAVSMEDIAKECGISKRTIYEFYNSKQALVNTIIDELIQSHRQVFKSIHSTAESALDEVLKQDHGVSQVCKGIRPSFLSELEDLFTDAWEKLEHYKLEIHRDIIDNLERGKKEAVYRANIDIKIISDLRLYQLVNILNPELMTGLNVNVRQLSVQLTILYLHSIVSEKGKAQLDKYLDDKSSDFES